jgi:magnesium chelatase subunit H
VKATFLYVGASSPGPLRRAERDINERYKLDLQIALHNCGAELLEDAWNVAERDIAESEIVFIIHVTNQENASRIMSTLDKNGAASRAVIAINCMPDLMRCTRMGKLDFARLMSPRGPAAADTALGAPSVGRAVATGSRRGRAARDGAADTVPRAPSVRRAVATGSAPSLVRRLGTWMADSIKGSRSGTERRASGPAHYTRLISYLPSILRFLPAAGKLADIKHYLYLYCYFLQPTPANIRSMVLYAIKHYVPGNKRLKIQAPESLPAVGIYHPDAPALFETFEAYRTWYRSNRRLSLDRDHTIGLLLMRPQIVSKTRGHYDRLIHAIEEEGLSVIPAISTFMDNREACGEFFVEQGKSRGRAEVITTGNGASQSGANGLSGGTPRVSQILSLTGFSFVGGPAMNDSQAAVSFLKDLNVPLRSMVSLDIQSIESWQQSRLGLNPVQTAMQVAIPEIDGATEPFIYGGMPQSGVEPEPIEDRCLRIARRIARWNRLQTVPPGEIKVALVLFCFPPNKGNIGTAAELDVFPSLIEILNRLRQEGYNLEPPGDADALRDLLIGTDTANGHMPANVAYRMSVDEYRRLCPYVDEVEREWGRAPGRINSNGRELLIPGIRLGNVFIGVQPSFGYEGDPMRLLAAEGGAPHHGFMALYTYIERVFRADALIHVGTHGALEFMPGKQVGLSSGCWPDRLIGELPNVYIYSVNNPSEGTIARRRSYAELVSYLTPPIDNAGLYRELASLKETLMAYRQSANESERNQLFLSIEEQATSLRL